MQPLLNDIERNAAISPKEEKAKVTKHQQFLKGRIALEPDILNVPGQTPQDLALSLSADNLSVVHAPSH